MVMLFSVDQDLQVTLLMPHAYCQAKDWNRFSLNLFAHWNTNIYFMQFNPKLHNYLVFSRHINVTMLPPELQIMTDQGFAHRLPVIVLPRANQLQIPCRMRRLNISNIVIIFFSTFSNLCMYLK